MPVSHTPRTINVQEFIDAHALSGVQKLLLALCFLVVAIDGFDTAIIGFIAPALRAEWHVDVARLGPLFAAGLLGLLAGALAVGPLADRLGRKAMLTTSMVCFGAATLASVFSGGITSLTALRFLTGVGLGGAMPTTITLSAEYCPESRRSSLVTLMFCGFTIGSAAAGLIAAQVLARHGWRPLLAGGALAPLALAPVLALALPESIRYLVARRSDPQAVSAVLRRIDPAADLDDAAFVGPAPTTRSPVRQLFEGPLVGGTLLLWLAFFMSLLVVYLLTNWMPTLIQRAGASLTGASLITAMFQIGGTVGAILIGRAMDRFEPHRVLGIVYVAAGGCVLLMGSATRAPALMSIAVFGAGFCVSGGQVGANALSAAFYPTAYRATGVSWANAAGRSGSVIGSLIGGVLLGAGWSLPAIYGLVAVPTTIAALAMFALGATRRSRGSSV